MSESLLFLHLCIHSTATHKTDLNALLALATPQTDPPRIAQSEALVMFIKLMLTDETEIKSSERIFYGAINAFLFAPNLFFRKSIKEESKISVSHFSQWIKRKTDINSQALAHCRHITYYILCGMIMRRVNCKRHLRNVFRLPSAAGVKGGKKRANHYSFFIAS